MTTSYCCSSNARQQQSKVSLGSYVFPDVNAHFTVLERDWFLKEFELTVDHLATTFIKVGPSTNAYNCHAWSLGKTDDAISPSGKTIDDFDFFYMPYKLDRVSKTKALIAVYGKSMTELDHVAVEIRGKWTSKLGPGPLVIHINGLQDLEGHKRYGDVQAYYGFKYSMENPF